MKIVFSHKMILQSWKWENIGNPTRLYLSRHDHCRHNGYPSYQMHGVSFIPYNDEYDIRLEEIRWKLAFSGVYEQLPNIFENDEFMMQDLIKKSEEVDDYLINRIIPLGIFL